MTTTSRYPVFSRNFDDEQDYVDAAVSAARRASPLLGLAPVLRWKRGLLPAGDGDSGVVSSAMVSVARLLADRRGREGNEEGVVAVACLPALLMEGSGEKKEAWRGMSALYTGCAPGGRTRLQSCLFCVQR